ncbi:MAG: HD-GYP domain-containing protein [Candidatus Aminicenantia bacterium]
MIRESKIHQFDLIMSLSSAVDLVSQVVANHHKRTAYIASSIAAELGLSKEEQNDLVIAGALHDIGAISLKERLDTLNFEIEDPHRHAELGYLLIKTFEPFSKIALLVRSHHVPWSEGNGSEFRGKPVPMGSHILHLADRVDVLINIQKEVLGQVKDIYNKIENHAGKMFVPELVEAFKSLTTKEYFWLDAVAPSIDQILSRQVRLATIGLDLDGLLSLAKLFSQVIDFRSRFTSTHSSGVAVSAEVLARLVGFSERECQQMKIAGYLHDLGKLAVPVEILEKPGKLTEDEFNVVRSHTFYTYRILEPISALDVINTWASFHHERLDGTGYPFHHKGQDLSLGSRIMAVADVFTAITEDRPYRKGMASNKALQVLQKMADNSVLDPNIVSLLRLHFDEINSLRIATQKTSVEDYQKFMESLD